MKKVLISTNHLYRYSGSEIIVLEVIEYFRRQGYAVDVFANYIERPFLEGIQALQANFIADPEAVFPFNYDVVWVQHHTAQLFNYSESNAEETLFLFAHLSSFEPFESPGCIMEDILVDKVLLNSMETYHHVKKLGLPEDKIQIFYNAAPQTFWRIGEVEKEISPLKTVMLVSNHAPPELKEALTILRDEESLNVIYMGELGGDIKRLSAAHLQKIDTVITIGKTIQYAIAANRAPYCYDYFGGPGYLTAENFDVAESRNFSGRCCRTKKTAAQIAEEIKNGYENACHFVEEKRKTLNERYHFDHMMGTLLVAQKPLLSNVEKACILQENQPLVRREKSMAQLIARLYKQKPPMR
ncbi:MAG: hypothetical protein ACTSXQ_02835 [Alphaproteobacteria bacterium]